MFQRYDTRCSRKGDSYKFILRLEHGRITNVTYALGNNGPQITTVEGRNHSQLPPTSA
jgi:hypothetical protein